MNILMTNDDGCEAKGINTLFNILSKEHNVYMVAPDSNRSAVSNHFSFFTSQTLKVIDEKRFASSGFPADCIFTGLYSDLIPEKIDLVVSGINHGGNLGTDIIYSGTCAAARQSVLLGVPALAVSIEPEVWNDEAYKNLNFTPISEFILKNLNKLYELAKSVQPNHFININGLSISEYKGVEFSTSLCERTYCHYVKLEKQDGGEIKTTLVPDTNEAVPEKQSDLDIMRKGFISISSINVQPDSSNLVDDITFSL